MTIKKQMLNTALYVLGTAALVSCGASPTDIAQSTDNAAQSAANVSQAAASTASTAARADLSKPDFFVVSNKADGNSIYQFGSRSDGQYMMKGEYKTGGTGTGDLEIPALKKDPTHPLANGDDPLISAYSISSSQDGQNIVVVNPGNATISLMKRDEAGKVSAVNTAPATDLFPISVAVKGDYVAVASVGDSNMKGSIGLYKIVDNMLVPLDNNRRDLSARPSTIRFSSNGKFVIVNELVTGQIKTFAMNGDQLSDAPVSVIGSPKADGRFQAIPVGFELRADANADILIVSEARFLTPEYGLREGDGSVVQSPLYSWQTGSLSTYKLANDGTLSMISADVLTGNDIEGGEIANCWVALSPDGQTLWAANALSSSISSFDIAANGEATLKNVTAYKDESEALFFGDINVSPDGKTLYQAIGNKGKVAIFDIKANGDLELRQMVGDMPKLGTYGLLLTP